MATQEERQEFIFPPNDNSAQTNLRYDLTAEKWMIAMRSAELKHKSTSIIADLKVIGLVFSLVFSLITLVVILILDFVKWVRSKIFI